MLEVDKELPPRTPIKLEIGLEKFYHVRGKVRWIKPKPPDKYLIGIEFDTVQEFPILELKEVLARAA